MKYINEIPRKNSCSPSQFALAWLMTQGDCVRRSAGARADGERPITEGRVRASEDHRGPARDGASDGFAIAPIPGTTSIQRLEENLGARQVGLSTDELRWFRTRVSRGVAAGSRYPDAAMRTING